VGRTEFYLFFIPVLTVATVGVSFLMISFAMTQGAFQVTTKRGLLSLSLVLVLIAAVYVSAQAYKPLVPTRAPATVGHAG
jgi:hypothetical protein